MPYVFCSMFSSLNNSFLLQSSLLLPFLSLYLYNHQLVPPHLFITYQSSFYPQHFHLNHLTIYVSVTHYFFPYWSLSTCIIIKLLPFTFSSPAHLPFIPNRLPKSSSHQLRSMVGFFFTYKFLPGLSFYSYFLFFPALLLHCASTCYPHLPSLIYHIWLYFIISLSYFTWSDFQSSLLSYISSSPVHLSSILTCFLNSSSPVYSFLTLSYISTATWSGFSVLITFLHLALYVTILCFLESSTPVVCSVISFSSLLPHTHTSSLQPSLLSCTPSSPITYTSYSHLHPFPLTCPQTHLGFLGIFLSI